MSTSIITRGEHPRSIQWHWHDGATDAQKFAFMTDVLTNEAHIHAETVKAWVAACAGKPAGLVELVERLDPDRSLDVIRKLDGPQAKSVIVLALAGVAAGFDGYAGIMRMRMRSDARGIPRAWSTGRTPT